MAVFGKTPDEKQERILADVINRMNENVQRLRVIEQKMQATDTRMNSIEQNFVSYNKNIQRSAAERDAKIGQLEERVGRIETTYKEILNQLKLVATKTNVDEIRQLISIYDPMKSSFVTKEEMESFIDEKLSKP